MAEKQKWAVSSLAEVPEDVCRSLLYSLQRCDARLLRTLSLLFLFFL